MCCGRQHQHCTHCCSLSWPAWRTHSYIDDPPTQRSLSFPHQVGSTGSAERQQQKCMRGSASRLNVCVSEAINRKINALVRGHQALRIWWYAASRNRPASVPNSPKLYVIFLCTCILRTPTYVHTSTMFGRIHVFRGANRAKAKTAVTLTVATAAALWGLSTLGVFDARSNSIEPAGWQARQVRGDPCLLSDPHFSCDAMLSTR